VLVVEGTVVLVVVGTRLVVVLVVTTVVVVDEDDVVVAVVDVVVTMVEDVVTVVDVVVTMMEEEVVVAKVVDVVVIDVLVVVVLVGQPQVKVPGTATASRIGWLSMSDTFRFPMSSETTLPGVQGGMTSTRRIVMTVPVPGAIDPPEKLTIKALMVLLAETSFAVQVNPEVLLVQDTLPMAGNESSSGVSCSANWMPRTSVGGVSFVSSIGTSMSVAPGSAQRSSGMLTITVARAPPGAIDARRREARRARGARPVARMTLE